MFGKGPCESVRGQTTPLAQVYPGFRAKVWHPGYHEQTAPLATVLGDFGDFSALEVGVW